MFALNLLVIILGSMFLLFLASGLLWRVGAWRVRPLDALMEDEGLPLGSTAPEVAAYSGLQGAQEAHLSFEGAITFLAFGAPGCEPCIDLVREAPRHPATRHWRLVYVAGGKDERYADLDQLPPDDLRRWHIYRFHDERMSRRAFNAPVSPYYHVIGSNGRVFAKGVGSRAAHLDRLLEFAPP